MPEQVDITSCSDDTNPTRQDPKPPWGFPKSEGQSLSYWLQQARCDELLDHGSTEGLQESADIVVIGSGVRYAVMTGCLVSKHLKETWPSRSVVVLEARDFCSGATGRNAGHCKAGSWSGFAGYEKRFGAWQAIKIIENERKTWEALVAYVRENDVECDLWLGDTFDVATSPSVAVKASETFAKYKAAGGKDDHIRVTTDPVSAAAISRVKNAQACYAWPASTLQPWKLTAHIMRASLAKGIALHTFTPVRCIVAGEGSASKWRVCTERGDIECNVVVHATNAYIGAQEPLFRNIIKPTVHVCNKVIPPVSFSGSKSLRNSYTIMLPDDKSWITINPRCTSDGVLLFGGQNPAQKRFHQWIEQHPEHCVNDSFSNLQEITDEVRNFARAEFGGWGDEGSMGPGQGCDYRWSGILGMSADRVPFIGEIPGKDGQWVCAGHNGQGMSRIFTAAPALVQLIKGESWEETGLPEVFRLTTERVRKLGEQVDML